MDGTQGFPEAGSLQERFANWWWELASPDLAVLAAQGALVVLGTGAVEQHGAHLPVGTDSLIANELLERVVRRLNERPLALWEEEALVVGGGGVTVATPAGEGAANAPKVIRRVVVLPTLTLGCSVEHTQFPGTLALSPATMEAYLTDLAAALGRWGFSHLLLVNTHGGNSHLLKALTRTVRLKTQVIPLVYDLYSRPVLAPYGERFDYHAGEAETSLLLHSHAPLVRGERLEHGDNAPTTPNNVHPQLSLGLEVEFPWLTHEVAPSGVIGDPLAASAETGEWLWEVMTTDLVATIAKVVRHVNANAL